MISEGEKITKVDRTPVLQKSKQDVINLLKKKKNESETVIGLIKNPSPAIAFLDKVMIYPSYHYSLYLQHHLVSQAHTQKVTGCFILLCQG